MVAPMKEAVTRWCRVRLSLSHSPVEETVDLLRISPSRGRQKRRLLPMNMRPVRRPGRRRGRMVCRPFRADTEGFQPADNSSPNGAAIREPGASPRAVSGAPRVHGRSEPASSPVGSLRVSGKPCGPSVPPLMLNSSKHERGLFQQPAKARTARIGAQFVIAPPLRRDPGPPRASRPFGAAPLTSLPGAPPSRPIPAFHQLPPRRRPRA